jgi:MFS family permease
VFAAVVIHQIEARIAELPAPAAEAARGGSPSAAGVHLPLYALVVPLAALVVLKAADSTRFVYLPLVIFQVFHDAGIAPLMFGITAAVELVTLPLLGYLSTQTGEKTAMVLGALAGAPYFLILSFTQLLPLLYLAQVIYAVFNAALLGVAMAYVQQLLANRAGMGSSLYLAVLNIGSLVGILSPLSVTGYDQKIFIIPAILCISAAVLLLVGDHTAQIEKRLSQASASAIGTVMPDTIALDRRPPLN